MVNPLEKVWLQVSLTELILLGESSNTQPSVIINCIFLILWVTILTLPLIQSELIPEHVISCVYLFKTLTQRFIFLGLWHSESYSDLMKINISYPEACWDCFPNFGCNLKSKSSYCFCSIVMCEMCQRTHCFQVLMAVWNWDFRLKSGLEEQPKHRHFRCDE